MSEEKVLWESKLEFDYRGVHYCDWIAVTCMDFRMWKKVVAFLEEQFDVQENDASFSPGAAKAIIESESGDAVDMALKVAFENHQAKGLVIVNHNDCGAYGGEAKFEGNLEAERKFHKAELRKAYKLVKEKFPEKKVVLIYAEVDFENIVRFIEISSAQGVQFDEEQLKKAA